MFLEKRVYPLLGVVLTAAIVCISIWRLSGCPGPPFCYYETSSFLLLVPGNATSSTPYAMNVLPPGDEEMLIDLRNFTFLMNDPICNSSSPPLFVVIVHSAPQNAESRHIIRETWGQGLHLVFLVGETNSTDLQASIERENGQNHDIVQGNFKDSYRNLTYKHVMALKWATYYCPGAKYVLKTDDDVFVNTPYFQEFLVTELSPLGARRLILCDVLYKPIVKRTYRSKWRVSHAEYQGRWYPDYCSGWSILYSPDVIFQLYREAQHSSYFWIDDVHVTGTLLSRFNYSHTNLGPLRLLEEEAVNMMNSGIISEFLFSLLPVEHFHRLWKMINSSRATQTVPVGAAWKRYWSNYR